MDIKEIKLPDGTLLRSGAAFDDAGQHLLNRAYSHTTADGKSMAGKEGISRNNMGGPVEQATATFHEHMPVKT